MRRNRESKTRIRWNDRVMDRDRDSQAQMRRGTGQRRIKEGK